MKNQKNKYILNKVLLDVSFVLSLVMVAYIADRLKVTVAVISCSSAVLWFAFFASYMYKYDEHRLAKFRDESMSKTEEEIE